jgi:ABC-type nitrate/sulfonate/bicarbonate transport system ATPase subunit
MDLLVAENIAKSFNGKIVLKSCTISLEAGRATCLVGPSGLGKSTLLEIMAGIQEPGAGTLRRRGKVSFMFQDNALIPWLSAEKNLKYILPRDISPAEADDMAALWLDRFGLERHTLPPDMSGGMRRRLSLARTFMAGRPITILDEPFAFLDRYWHSLVAGLVSKLASDGQAVALAGHSVNPELLEECGDRLVVVPLSGSPLEIPSPGGEAQIQGFSLDKG